MSLLQIASKIRSNSKLRIFSFDDFHISKIILKRLRGTSRSDEENGLKKFVPGKVHDEWKPGLPTCPEYIGSTTPEECSEFKPSKKWWQYFSKGRPVSEKPTNTPVECPKVETLAEYFFGPEKPKPENMFAVCKRKFYAKEEYKNVGPPYEDPNCKLLCGDLYLYTEPQIIKTEYVFEPRITNPKPYRPPGAVICRRISTCFEKTGCSMTCSKFRPEPCSDIKCPVRPDAFKKPYEELRPVKPDKKLFSCKEGLAAKDINEPVKTESCTCMHRKILRKLAPVSCQSCALHDYLESKERIYEDTEYPKPVVRRMSRSDRLKHILMDIAYKREIYGKKKHFCYDDCCGFKG